LPEDSGTGGAVRAVRCVLRAERVHSPCLTIARAAPGSGAGRNPDGLLLAHASGACGHLHRPKHGCGRDRRRGSGCLVGVTGSPVRPRAGPVPVQALCSRCEHMRLRCRGVYPTGRIVQGVNAVNGGTWWSGGLERPGMVVHRSRPTRQTPPFLLH
jgi:hypothetical protein